MKKVYLEPATVERYALPLEKFLASSSGVSTENLTIQDDMGDSFDNV